MHSFLGLGRRRHVISRACKYNPASRACLESTWPVRENLSKTNNNNNKKGDTQTPLLAEWDWRKSSSEG